MDCEQLEKPKKRTPKESKPDANEPSNADKKREKRNHRDDLGGMASDLFGRVNFKVAIFLMIFGVFIFSDLFIENVLSRIKDTTSADTTTTKGTMIQLLIIVLFYLIIDMLVQCEVI